MNLAEAGVTTVVLGFAWMAVLWFAFEMTMAALAAAAIGSLGIVVMVLFGEADESPESAPSAEDLE